MECSYKYIPKERHIITLFKSIKVLYGLTIFYEIFPTCNMYDKVVCRILVVPQNTIINMKNVMMTTTT